MGIEPELWNQRLYGSKLTIKKGEWLDNLVFSYTFCDENTMFSDRLQDLENEIRKYFSEIYDKSSFCTIIEIIEAWKCRKYDPLIVFGWREPSLFEDFEKEELSEYNKIDKKVRNMYESYHCKDSINKYNQMIQIEPLEFFTCKELRLLQNCMVDFLNSKAIAVETLLTSNIRISYYKEYSEHHIIRWLGLSNENDPKPNVVVGSDDTGVFMTNLQNEYLHLYQILCKEDKVADVIKKIKYLNDMSAQYTFENHNMNLSKSLYTQDIQCPKGMDKIKGLNK